MDYRSAYIREDHKEGGNSDQKQFEPHHDKDLKHGYGKHIPHNYFMVLKTFLNRQTSNIIEPPCFVKIVVCCMDETLAS